MHRPLAVLAVVIALTATGCSSDKSTSDNKSDGDAVTLTLVTHDSFAVSDNVFKEFTNKTGIKVEVLPAGDAGAALNQVILTKDDPIGDVQFGVDTTFLSRALDADIYAPYTSPERSKVAATVGASEDDRVTPIDYGDVCVNFDRAAFGDTPPDALTDLTNERTKNQLVVENPATSSPGLAFLLATINAYGEDGWQDYWRELRGNGVQVTSGWEQAYNEAFSAGAGGGDRTMVVSYASSPVASVDPEADPLPTEAPVGTILDTCFRQVEYAGILKGTKHRAEAQQLVDFMLSEKFQEDVPLSMYVYPARDGVALPVLFQRYAQTPTTARSIDPATIEANREQWIEQWNDIVLR
jgi:thiamine transport system substrate-binding protein